MLSRDQAVPLQQASVPGLLVRLQTSLMPANRQTWLLLVECTSDKHCLRAATCCSCNLLLDSSCSRDC